MPDITYYLIYNYNIIIIVITLYNYNLLLYFILIYDNVIKLNSTMYY